MKRGVYLQLESGQIYAFKLHMALGDPGANNDGCDEEFGLTLNKLMNDPEMGEGFFGNRKGNPRKPVTIPCADPYEKPGFDVPWWNFRCSGCHRPLGGSRNAVIDLQLGFEGMRRSRSNATLDDNLQTPFPVKVPNELEGFFDGECWTGVSCLELIIRQGGRNLPPSSEHDSINPRVVTGKCLQKIPPPTSET